VYDTANLAGRMTMTDMVMNASTMQTRAALMSTPKPTILYKTHSQLPRPAFPPGDVLDSASGHTSVPLRDRKWRRSACSARRCTRSIPRPGPHCSPFLRVYTCLLSHTAVLAYTLLKAVKRRKHPRCTRRAVSEAPQLVLERGLGRGLR